MDIESLATVLIMQDQDHPLLDDDDALMMIAADMETDEPHHLRYGRFNLDVGFCHFPSLQTKPTVIN